MKILLATDGSDCSEEADRFLTRFHFTAQDDIIILHAVSEIPYEDDYHAQIRLVIKRVAPKILDDSVKILHPAKTKISVLTEIGDPSREILNMEKSLRPDVTAVGCRGLRGIKGMMGSVSRRILGNSESSVLIGKACAKVI